MNNIQRLYFMQEIQDNFEQIIRLLGFPIRHTLQSCREDLSVITRIFGPVLNRELSKSKYYYRKSRKVLHFTSVKALYSILNEKSIRLYNLHNSSDPTEYSFIGNTIGPFYLNQGYDEIFINGKIDYFKDNFFILSTTSVDELAHPKFWMEYGDKSKGVAIEFEIQNDPMDWDGFHFSQVFYGEPENWTRVLQQMILLGEQNPGNRYDFSFDMLFCLHKSPEQTYIDEKEIRILAQRPEMNGFVFDGFIAKDVNKDQCTEIRYLQLPLFAEDGYNLSFLNQIKELNNTNQEGFTFSDSDFVNYLNRSPKIKVVNVYVCQAFPMTSNRYETFVRSFSDLIYDKLGYPLEIKQIS